MLLTDREPGEQRRRSQKSQISQRDFHFQFLMIYGFATYVVQIQTRRKIKPCYVKLVIGKFLLLCIGVWPQTKQKCYLRKDLPDKNKGSGQNFKLSKLFSSESHPHYAPRSTEGD